MNRKIAGICIMILGCWSLAARAETGKTERQISVMGRGKVSAVPDQARIWVRVSEEGMKVDTLTQQVRQKMEAVLKVIKGQGIADKDIQTQSYQVTPKMEWRNGRSTRNGYTASNQVEVKIHDLKKVGTILAAVTDAGANDINGPQFEFENPQELERKALSQALADAKAKATLLAQTAGVSLGEVITIQEGAISRPGPRPMMMRAAAMQVADAAASEPIASGEEAIEANLTAQFGLK